MREPAFVPETKLAVELLQDFQSRRNLMAIVVDEFGSTVGLVTAEDVLEQIVGELEDEFDFATKPLLPNPGGSLLLDGATPLRDLSTQYRWNFPRESGVETLAGFVLAQLGHLPQPDESVVSNGRRYTVASMAARRITQVRVEEVDRIEAGAPEAAAASPARETR